MPKKVQEIFRFVKSNALKRFSIRSLVLLSLLILSGTHTFASGEEHSKNSVAPFTLSFVTSDFNGFGVSCTGANDGSVDMTINGGTSPFVIQWSTGASSEDINALTAGVYTVTVTDNDLDVVTETVTITEPGVILPVISSFQNISCNGLTDGSIDLSVSGGAGSYSFVWSDGSLTEDISALSAATYTVTVTDANLCTATTNATISEPDLLVATIQQAVDISCNGLTDGSIDINVTGGTGAYSFVWSDGSFTEDISALSAATYTVTVTDANLCTATTNATITEPDLLVATIQQAVDISCNGLTDGSIDISITGGTGAYSFVWSDGSLTEDISALAAATYTVTVTDANLCTATTNATIGEPDAIVIGLTPVPSSCSLSNGSITSSVTGGVGTYDYLWSNASVTASVTGLAAGTYTVTVTDDNGCTSVETSIVSALPPPVITVDSLTSVLCFGGNGGAAYITITDGTSPYTVQWSNGASTQDITGLIAGTYTVTVTDADLCTVTETVQITQPLAALNDSIQKSNSTCGLSNGTASVFPYGGTSPYGVLWSTGAVTTSIGALSAATYTVTITDANLCTRVSSVSILNIPGPVAVIDSVRDVRCFGGNTGAIYISVTGGTAPITYLWSNGSIAQDIINRTTGTYTVTVTDANSCTSTVSAFIAQPASVVNDSLVSTSSFCGNNNGTITVYPYGGTSPYTVLWSTGASTNTISGLAPGSYTVTVTDANLCTEQSSRNITNVPGPIAAVDSIRDVKCFGLSTGGVFISAPGGVSPKTYLWSNGAVIQDIGNVSAGTYTVTVTDNNGCTSQVSGTVSQPASALGATTQVTSSGCAVSTGSAEVLATGGTSPYTYLWNNGVNTALNNNIGAGTYTVTVTDFNNCTFQTTAIVLSTSNPSVVIDSTTNVNCFGLSTGAVYTTASSGTGPYTFSWSNSAVSEDITGVAAGVYTVTVTDANSCTATANATLTQPLAALNDSITTVSSICANNNGSATVFPYGGTQPYTVLWSTGAVVNTITSLSSGTYTVTITDANLCTRQAQATVIGSPAPVAVVDSIRNVACFGQSNGGIFISVSGGTAPLSYLWSNGAITQDLNNVVPGVYTVTVTDFNGCTDTISGSVVQPAAALNHTMQVTQTGCAANTGTAEVTVTGGTTPYTYQWSNGATNALNSGLAAGTYTVTITDFNNCTRTGTAVVTVANSPTVVVDSVKNVSCFNGTNGAVYVTASGGTLPYTYLWSTFAATEDLINVSAGTYTVSVTDFNGCTALVSAIVTQPAAALNDSVQITQATCGNSNGSVTVYPFNGTSPYTYQWNNSATTQTISNLSPGLYTVTVTDNNGCLRQRSVSILNIAGPTLVLDSIRNVNCFGGATGAVFVTSPGGTSPKTYLWSTGAVTQDLIGVIAGSYTVTVTDANGCTATLSATITQAASPLNDSLQITNAICGAPTGSITVFPYGGTSPYTFQWNTGQSSPTIFGLNTGTYTVTITDNVGCTRTDSATITNSGGPVVSIDSIVSVKCFGQTTGGIYITVSGGTLPYTYQWTGGAVSQDLINVGVGTYTVTVTDDNNCVSVVSGIVTQPPVLGASITVVDASCGLSNGSLTASGTGGTPPYSYVWNTGQPTAVLSGVPQGIYTVTVTDFNNCTAVRQDTVNNSDGPVVTIDQITNVDCFGDSTGAVSTTVTGGTGTITYSWSNGANTGNISNIPAGTYTVTVTDQNSCSSSVSAQVSQSTPISITSQIVNAICGGTGSITVTPSGGNSPYTYLWNTGAVTDSITNLSGGTYTVTVTDSLLCEYSESFNLISTSVPVIVTDSIVNVKCFGDSTGSVYISVTGGSFPFSYDWSDGSGSEDLQNVPSGVYTLIISDFYGCADTSVFTINQPTAIQDSLNNNPANCNLNNGSAKIYPFGGTPPYTYQWSSGCVSQTCTNMSPGLHTVTVTDANGCQIVRNTTIGQIPIHIVTNDSITNVSCNDGNNGAIYISVTSGITPYVYLWNNGSNTQDLTGINAGTYTVTVTDSVNCQVIQTYSVSEPDSISDNAVLADATCGLNNGSIILSATGGTGTLTYLWNNGTGGSSLTSLAPGIYTVTVTDQNSCTNQFVYELIDIPGPSVQLNTQQNVTCFGGNDGSIVIDVISGTQPFDFIWSNLDTTQNISGLTAGNYCVTVTDDNGCTAVECYTVTQADEIVATANIIDVSCGSTNGSVTVIPAGGTGGYTYEWNGGSTSQTINGLSAGVYTVTVTDNSSCSEDFQFTVTDLGSPAITIDSVLQITCAGDSTGAIYLSITGNSPPFTYQWSNGSTDEDQVGIAAGTYTVTVTDINNCSSSITQVINEPPYIESTFVVSPANCNTANGAIATTAFGGTGTLSYQWNTGPVTPSISNLAAGIYTLTITDQASCTVEFNVTVNNLSAPQITVTDSSHVTCAGLSNGSITVSVSGGQQPYGYAWTNTAQTTPAITGLTGNTTYTLTVTDALGCVALRSVFISEPDPIVISAIIPQRNDTFNLTCAGSNDGTIKLNINGGVTPYTYLWSNLALTDSIGGLAAGSYTVTVTDFNGCTAVRNFTITQPPLLVSSAGQNNIICGINSDTLDANIPVFGTGYWTIVSGGGIFQDSTLNNTIVTDLANGVNVFQWVVTDGICSAISQVVITYNTQIFAIPGINRVICADTVLLTATTPQFGYGYWQVVTSNGTIDDTSKAVTLVTGLNMGANVFRWVVINGTCSDSAEVVIIRQDPEFCIEEIELPTGFTPNEDGRNDYFFIKGINDYPENTFVVYNRWGNKVYEKSGYSNEWNGFNDSGEPLPEGTYFIIFKVKKGSRTFTGYVDLRR